MQAKPQEQHRWLEKLVGEWTYETDAGAPGETPEKLTGTETVRSLGGLWFLAEGEGRMPGGTEATTLMTLGYDPAKRRFVGTWVGSMMSYLWVYDGELEGDRKLALYADGPDVLGGTDDPAAGLVPYKDVVELVDDDHRTLTSHARDEAGVWQPFMVVRYRRR